MKLLPTETALVGKWRLVGGKVEANSTCRRIDRVVKDQLTQIGADESGWDTLYRDPADGRYWELTYPESDSEGGGPPQLVCLDQDSARAKYGDVVS